MDIETRKETILELITDFGIKLAAQPEVREAILNGKIPFWQRLTISEMGLRLEETLRKNIEVEDKPR